MKVRADFVTNSSSSSFVIMHKPIEIKEPNAYTKGLERMLNHLLDSGDTIDTMEELKNYIIADYGYRGEDTLEEILEDDSYAKQKYEEYKEKIESGYMVTQLSIEYGSDDLINMLYALDDGETFIVKGEN